MRCSEFRDQHSPFVDDTLAGVELVRMQRHVAECPDCAVHDAKVRRSLMLVRSIPHIAPSPDFSRSLAMRLQSCKDQPESVDCLSFKAVAAIGAVASLLMLGYVANALYRTGAPSQDIVLSPVVAMAVPPQPSIVLPRHLPNPPYPSVVTLAIPAESQATVWPTPPFVEQSPLRFVRYQQVH